MDSFEVFWLRGNSRYVVTHFFWVLKVTHFYKNFPPTNMEGPEYNCRLANKKG